jgi:hypothetical protein
MRAGVVILAIEGRPSLRTAPDRRMHRKHRRASGTACRDKSRQQASRYLVPLGGIVVFALLMALRDAVQGVAARALVAGLAGLVGSSAFLYVLRRTPKTGR